jgi:kynurenine formamidase
MCSPDIIRHVIGTLGPADHSGGVVARQPAGPIEVNSKRTCFSDVRDLTHPLPETFPSASGDQWLEVQDFLTFAEQGINFRRWLVHEHIGTHIDAPIHFSEDGATVDEISISALVAPLAVLDIRDRAAMDPDAQLTPEDVLAWEARHGEVPEGCCVAMNSGWDVRATGAGYRNAGHDGVMHFPGIHVEAAQLLLEERSVAGLAVDTLSIDRGPSTDFPVHRAWLPSGRWAAEGLANLSGVPEVGATIVVGAPTIVGGSGGPSRIMALV